MAAAAASTVVDLEGSCGDSGISNEDTFPTSAAAAVSFRSGRHSHSASQPVPELLHQNSLPTGADLLYHPMAMSAISEAPSTPTSKTPSTPLDHTQPSLQQQAYQQNGGGVFPRSSRMTQSLTYGKGVSAQTRRQMLAHSLAMLGHETRSKQRDLDRREREVQDATTKATEQVEYMLRLTDKLHKCEDENSRLRQQLEVFETEMGKLLDELQEKDAELEEKEDELSRCSAYCDELLEELGKSRKDIAQIRAKADQLRVEKVVLSRTQADGQKSLTEWEDMKRANLRLQRQAAHAEKAARKAQREVEALRGALQELQAEHQRLVDDFGDDERSKKELLMMIRRLAEDKLVWEGYCTRLLTRAVAVAPQLLCLDGGDKVSPLSAADETGEASVSSAGGQEELRWEAMFNTLLKAVMQKDPGLADCVVTAGDA